MLKALYRSTGPILALTAAAAAPHASASSCLSTRAAFDVGSGTTKMKVATVDTCTQKIVSVIKDEQIPVGYKEDLSASSENSFGRSIMVKGIEALQTLKESAIASGATEFAGVATSAFRDAVNGQTFLNRAQSETGIQLKIITQDEEARIGFYGALTQAEAPIDDLVVWDIGGGSMQIITRDEKGEFLIFRGDLASVSFKDHLIKEIQGRDADSPNPISAQNAAVGVMRAWLHAVTNVPPTFLEKIRNPKTVVYGIGGVHTYSVRTQIGKGTAKYTKSELTAKAQERLGLTDEQIGGKYASTEVSNLILVLGYMEALGISSVMTAKVNLADGVLVNPAFWNPSN